MGIPRLSETRGHPRAAQIPGHVMLGLLTASVAMPTPSPAQVQGLSVIGPALRWLGVHITEAGFEVAVGEVVKKALKLDDCHDCERRLEAIEAELKRQASVADQARVALTAELAGVRSELQGLRAFREGRIEEAARAYQASMDQLAMVPELREEVRDIRADVEAVKVAIQEMKVKLEEFGYRLGKVETNTQVTREQIQTLSAQLRANTNFSGGGGTAPQAFQQRPPPAVLYQFPMLPPFMSGWVSMPLVPMGYPQPSRNCAPRTVWLRGPYGRPHPAQICVRLH